MVQNKNAKVIDRRQFIKTSTAAGASLILAPHVLTGAKSFGVDDINVALLGAGAQGQVLMNACLKIPGIRFKAVCDIWKEYNQKRVYRLLGKYGHKLNAYEDYREMLANEKDLDAVIVATPDFWHAEHTTACLEAGLNVYCEKEMSNTLEGAKQIVRAAKKSGKLLQVGHQRRSNPRYIHCYEKLIKEAKILGHITTINGQWNRAVQPDLGWPEKYAIPQPRLEQYGFQSMA
ncbi:MAG: Gfo/Idh/MocA family oxidoreductase, partial [Candidatus Neomarinimicrobiota bacterium]|nr:Gfo/Idh/MocA family oxidoreductase [Candidatus Neomarinimicrobiota bacterium]